MSTTDQSRQRHEVAHRATGADSLGSVGNGICVDPIVPIEIADRSGLAEMLNPERLDPVAVDASEPAESCRVITASLWALAWPDLIVGLGIAEINTRRTYRPAELARGRGLVQVSAAVFGWAPLNARLRRERASDASSQAAGRHPLGVTAGGLAQAGIHQEPRAVLHQAVATRHPRRSPSAPEPLARETCGCQ